MNKPLHKNLLRQIAKSGVDLNTIPVQFLEMISKSYSSYEEQIEMTNKISAINEAEIENANAKYNAEKERKFEEILNRLPGYVSLFDFDLRYIGVNKLLANFYNLEPENFINSRIGDLVKGNTSISFIEKINSFLNSNSELCSFDFQIVNDIETRDVIIYVQRIESEKIIFAFGVDVTEKMKMQREIEQKKVLDNHNARIMSLGEMAAGIAHEINNPLAIIKGNAQLLDRCIVDLNSSEFKKKQSRIIEASNRIIKILTNLKLLSKSTEFEVPSKINFVSISESALELCEFKLLDKNIKILTKFETDKLFINVIATEILQVLHNLFNNSIDAVENLDDAWIELRVFEANNNLIIHVTDSGLGISESYLQKIWEPFFTTKTGVKGTGLGLPICKNLINKNNGDFFYDTSSKHTRFVIVFPLVNELSSTFNKVS